MHAWVRRPAAWAAGVAILISCAIPAHAEGPLLLPQVLGTLEGTHPELKRARQDVRMARARSMSADGGFDPKLSIDTKAWAFGYYDKGQIEILLNQATPLWGTTLYAGWRRSIGTKIPVYDSNLETLSGGEFRLGMEVPVWRNGPIDKRRAEIQKAELNTQQTEYEVKSFRLLLRNAAAHAYWKWVEAGLKLQIERELLNLALVRDEGIRKRAKAGEAAGILELDSRRSVLTRRTRVVDAEQKLQQAALKLSLFYRDKQQQPIAPAEGRLPKLIPEPNKPDAKQLLADVREALKKRPDLIALKRARDQARVQVELTDNQVAPDIKIWSEVAKDVGSVTAGRFGQEVLEPWDWAVGIKIEAPLLLRKARGEARQAEAKEVAAAAKIRAGRDKVAAEIRIAYAALDAAFRTVGFARNARAAAERLAEAERRRLTLGSSDLLVLTLREVSAADSAKKVIEALGNYQRARADYQTTTAQGLR